MFAYVLVRALCTARFSFIYLGANGHFFFFFVFGYLWKNQDLTSISNIYSHETHIGPQSK